MIHIFGLVVILVIMAVALAVHTAWLQWALLGTAILVVIITTHGGRRSKWPK